MTLESSPISPAAERPELKPDLELNDAEVLLERVNDPIIKEQILDVLEAAEQNERGKEWSNVVLRDGEFVHDEEGKMQLQRYRYVPKTRDQLRVELEERIREVSTDTRIIYDGHHPRAGGREVMPVPWKPDGTKEATLKMKTVALAHEKGHIIRPYQGSYFDEYFRDALDAGAMRFTPEVMALYRSYSRDVQKSDEEFRKELTDYLMRANEIAERMSQLKNYFGLRSAQPFTAEHLRYAREHYVNDTGLDNQMSLFLDAVTPEREVDFLRIINEAGI